jgi:hypothetical protein
MSTEPARSKEARLAKQLRLAGVPDKPEKKPGHGGKRAGAGRKLAPGKRPSLPHRARSRHTGRRPVHVTLRVRAGLPSLRSQLGAAELHGVLARQAKRLDGATFQVVEFSLQSNHLHLIVEAGAAHHADGAEGARGAHHTEGAERALRAGVAGLAIAFARGINRLLQRRGKVWADRWHSRELATPREVRNALLYVFRNLARHGTRMFGDTLVDPFSSAATFDGWARPVSALLPTEPWVHPRPRTWLLGSGWRIHGLLDPDEARRTGR